MRWLKKEILIDLNERRTKGVDFHNHKLVSVIKIKKRKLRDILELRRVSTERAKEKIEIGEWMKDFSKGVTR